MVETKVEEGQGRQTTREDVGDRGKDEIGIILRCTQRNNHTNA